MKHLKLRRGTEAPKWPHFNYLSEAAADGIRLALADLIAIAPSFYVTGAEVTETPVGIDTEYAITEGVVMLGGEPMTIAASSVIKSPTQVVFIEPEEVPLDPIPTRNLDGGQDQVMIERRARLAVASLLPTVSMPLASMRKEDIERLRFKGRLVPLGTVMPYAGSMDHFNGTGLGLVGTPMEGWAVANGLNGTVDMRGLVPLGATAVPASGAGAVSAGVGGTSDPGDLVGADLKVIAADQLPEHVHDHTILNVGGSGGDVQAGSQYVRSNITGTTQPNATPNDAFDVRQAGRAFVFIQSII